MHLPVLLDAALEWLDVSADGVYADCTAGGGGHSEAIARRLGEKGRLLCIDRDAEAVERVRARLAGFENVTVVHADYRDLHDILERNAMPSADGVLIDAGLSSYQIDTPERGFSFQSEGPLDMRMDTTAEVTAASLLNTAPVEEIEGMLREYGDLRDARKLARAIVQHRDTQPFASTADLTAVVNGVYHFVSGQPSEMRTVFQAIRIAVNHEYDSLEAGVHAAIDALKPGGRIVCITFHSGEDRIVKNAFRAASRKRTELHPDGRIKTEAPPVLRLLTGKPVQPGAEEIASNRRAQSAKLRAAERRDDTP